MKRPILFAVALFAAVCVRAQDPQPPPEAPAPEATVEVAPPEPSPPPEAAATVDLPAALEAELSAPEEAAIDVGAALTANAVAKGETTEAEAGRDPGSALDFGSTWQVAVLLYLFGSLSPMFTALMKRMGVVAPEIAAGANTLFAVGFFLLAWWLLHERYAWAPQDPLAWVLLGGAGGGSGQAVRSVWVNRKELLAKLLAMLGIGQKAPVKP